MYLSYIFSYTLILFTEKNKKQHYSYKNKEQSPSQSSEDVLYVEPEDWKLDVVAAAVAISLTTLVENSITLLMGD